MMSCYEGYEGCHLKGLPIGIPFRSQFFIPKSKKATIPDDEDLFILLRLNNMGVDVSKLDELNQLRAAESVVHMREATNMASDKRLKAIGADNHDPKESSDAKGVIKKLLSRHLEEEKLTKGHSDKQMAVDDTHLTKVKDSLKELMTMLFDADISRILSNLQDMNVCKKLDKNHCRDIKKGKMKGPGRKRPGNSLDKTPKNPAKKIKVIERDEGKRKSERIRSSGIHPNYNALEKGPEELHDIVSDSEGSDFDEERETVSLKEETFPKQEPNEESIMAFSDVLVESVVEQSQDTGDLEDGNDKKKNDKIGPKKTKRRSSEEEDPDFTLTDTNVGKNTVDEDPSISIKPENDDNVLSESDDDNEHKVKKGKGRKSLKNHEVVELDPELVGLSMKEKTRVKRQRIKIEKELKRIKIKLQDHPDKYRVDIMESFARKDRGKSRLECATEVLVCTVCEKFKAKSTDAMETHIESHVNGELNCVECTYIAPFINDLVRHKREVHKRNVNICFECGIETNGLDGLRDHLGKVHGKPQYKCKYCLQEKNEHFAVATKNNYRQHIRQEHQDKMAACKTCSRLFANGTMLKKHMELGCAGERPSYACEKCGKTYNSQDRVNDHVERVHNKVRRFQCPHCPFTAARGAGLNQHLHIHTGYHPFKCDQCTFTCVQKYQLTSHMRTHTGAKPYKCNLCNYAAAWNVQLKDHVKVHGMINTVVCEMCNIVFKDMRTFKTHQSKEHPVETHQARQPMETHHDIRQSVEVQQVRQPMETLQVTQPSDSFQVRQSLMNM